MGGGEIIYLSLHCQHQNDSYIRMGSDESHFKVSLIMRDKVTGQCTQTTTSEEKTTQIRLKHCFTSTKTVGLLGGGGGGQQGAYCWIKSKNKIVVGCALYCGLRLY